MTMSEPTESPTPRPNELDLEGIRRACVQGRVGLSPIGAQKLLAEIDALKQELEEKT